MSEASEEEIWAPLERIFSSEQCADFMHIGSQGTLQQYKHRETRRYINIDAISGEFFFLQQWFLYSGQQSSRSGPCLRIDRINKRSSSYGKVNE